MSRRRQVDRNAEKSTSGFNPKGVTPRSENQETFLKAILENDIVMCYGPPGTGKTHIATGVAAQMLRKASISKIVLTRPVVEAGNSIGYLPGTMQEKVGPYLVPLFDELSRFITPAKMKALMASNTVEIAPLSMMRGRTFTDAVVICDEAQNGNLTELRMLLTRIGPNAKLLLLGDLAQSDLPAAAQGAFQKCLTKLTKIDGIGIVELDVEDIVRHRLVGIICERLA